MTTNNAVNTTLAGQTGTGNFVGATSPTIVTPSIAQINNAAHNLPVILLLGPASSVNSFQMFPSATGNPVQLIAGGTDPNISMVIAGTGTGGIALHGYADGSSAAAGYVGEVITSTILFGSAVVITTSGTAQNVTSISVTAGDWDIFGAVGGSGTTCTFVRGGISTTTGTLPDAALQCAFTPNTSAGFGSANVPTISVSISSTTTYYLIVGVTGTTQGVDLKGYGTITARRRR